MAAVLICLILALDQATKFVASRALSLHETIPLIPGMLHLTLVYNKGAAFGVLKNRVPFFIAVSVIAVGIIAYQLIKRGFRAGDIVSSSLALILAGALGNLIDRLIYGYVVDFIDFRVWPVFNVADSAITIGASLLVWHMLRKGHRKDNEQMNKFQMNKTKRRKRIKDKILFFIFCLFLVIVLFLCAFVPLFIVFIISSQS